MANAMIKSLPTNVFRNCSRMEELYLQRNNFTNFSVHISHMINLKRLDLSFNQITCLSDSAQNDIQSISNHTYIVIDLSGNDLRCSCDCLRFYTWFAQMMKHNKNISFNNLDQYECTTSVGAVLKLNHLKQDLPDLYYSCTTRDLIYVAFIMTAFALFAITTGTFTFRFWFALEFCWYR